MKAVSKNPAYADIVSYKKVTKTRITVTAENRCEYSVCGKWQKRKINGENYRWFNCDEDLEKNLLTDAKGILLEKENKE